MGLPVFRPRGATKQLYFCYRRRKNSRSLRACCVPGALRCQGHARVRNASLPRRRSEAGVIMRCSSSSHRSATSRSQNVISTSVTTSECRCSSYIPLAHGESDSLRAEVTQLVGSRIGVGTQVTLTSRTTAHGTWQEAYREACGL